MKMLIGVLVACTATAVYADQKLAEKKNCLACHSVKDKIVGPAFKDVAAKYSGKAEAAGMLAEKIQKGGVGTWGQVPMPPNDVTSAEAKQLADWVLSIK
jgi:cytochrome c